MGLPHLTPEQEQRRLENLRKARSSPESREKTRQQMLGNTLNKGKLSPKKGKKYPQVSHENNHAWKGEDASYPAIHAWVKRHLGKPDHCALDKDHKSEKYHWANKSGEYKRDLDDWIPLCPKCHRVYDGITGCTRSEEFKQKVSEGLKKAYREGRR